VSYQTLRALEDPAIGEAYSQNILSGYDNKMRHHEENLSQVRKETLDVSKIARNLENQVEALKKMNEDKERILKEEFGNEISKLRAEVQAKDAALRAEQVIASASRQPAPTMPSTSGTAKKTLRSNRASASTSKAADKLKNRGNTKLPKAAKPAIPEHDVSMNSEASDDSTAINLRNIASAPDNGMDTSSLEKPKN
jgi:dsDNA-specific endonuclease/ATPase MutS2